jgi:hypothetical protein
MGEALFKTENGGRGYISKLKVVREAIFKIEIGGRGYI